MSKEVRLLQEAYKAIYESQFTQAGPTSTLAPQAAPAAGNAPEAVVMSTKAKVLKLPPGVSSRMYPVTVGNVYRIVDRQGSTVTIVTPEHRKVVLPADHVQYV